MIRKKIGFPAAIALCCALAGAALAGCDDDAESDPNPEQGEGDRRPPRLTTAGTRRPAPRPSRSESTR